VQTIRILARTFCTSNTLSSRRRIVGPETEEFLDRIIAIVHQPSWWIDPGSSSTISSDEIIDIDHRYDITIIHEQFVSAPGRHSSLDLRTIRKNNFTEMRDRGCPCRNVRRRLRGGCRRAGSEIRSGYDILQKTMHCTIQQTVHEDREITSKGIINIAVARGMVWRSRGDRVAVVEGSRLPSL